MCGKSHSLFLICFFALLSVASHMVNAGGGFPGLVRQLHALRLQFGRRQLARRGWSLQLLHHPHDTQNVHRFFESVDFILVVIKALNSAATQDDFMRPPDCNSTVLQIWTGSRGRFGGIQSLNWLNAAIFYLFFIFAGNRLKYFLRPRKEKTVTSINVTLQKLNIISSANILLKIRQITSNVSARFEFVLNQ